MSDRIPPIRSELIAAKIEQIWNFEQLALLDESMAEPRFVSVLWFLEHVSKPQNYPGGLARFADDFIECCTDQLGTMTMMKVGRVPRYNASDAITILKEFPSEQRAELLGDEGWMLDELLYNKTPKKGRFTQTQEIWSDYDAAAVTWTGTHRELEQLLVEMFTPEAAQKACIRWAQRDLGEYLKSVCESPRVGLQPNGNGDGAPSCFHHVGAALLDFIDKRATILRSTIAETEVTQLVFRWMEKARTMKAPIMISGNSRFGKTEAAKLLCNTDPGRYRMVNTPASNSIGDLYREVAKSLGIEVGADRHFRSNLGELRDRIDYVLRFANLVLVFDEFQLALPANFSRNTVPARLNWVRRSVIDQGIAAVFICTPQSYLHAKKRFVNATGFAMQQWDERILKTVHLPTELSGADLLAVARIHFSDLPDAYLQLVVEAALATERNYVSDISKIATLAKDNAREQGRVRPLLSDLQAVIADVLPSVPTRTAAPQESVIADPPLPGRCNRPTQPLQASRITPGALSKSPLGTRRPLANLISK